MSRNYVSDPREVVKPGDVVRVKVLSVDVPRQRISLTLRLDDEGPRPPGRRDRAEDRPGRSSDLARTSRGSTARQPRDGSSGRGGSARDGSARGGSSGRGGSGRGRTGGGRPGQRDPAPVGALADALRRAGLVRDDRDDRDNRDNRDNRPRP
jgi:uncharacterized protein